ncbi:MAG: hypothetical protein WAP53_08795 [Dysgonamonadaceae bacterium]|jgi:hypothetical protein
MNGFMVDDMFIEFRLIFSGENDTEKIDGTKPFDRKQRRIDDFHFENQANYLSVEISNYRQILYLSAANL